MKLVQLVADDSMTGNVPDTKKRTLSHRTLLKYCELAQQSMADTIPRMRGEIRRNDNKLEGFVELNEGVLKFVGTMLAESVKQLAGG